MKKSIEFLEKLVEFRTSADLETFERIFGPQLCRHLWHQLQACDYDLVKWYATLDHINRPLFAAAIAPAGECYVAPTCGECGRELSSLDLAASEVICLDCGAELVAGELEVVIRIW